MHQLSRWKVAVASAVVVSTAFAQEHSQPVTGPHAKPARPSDAPLAVKPTAPALSAPAAEVLESQPLPQLSPADVQILNVPGMQRVTLAQAMETALQSNATLNTARVEIARTWALVEQTRSASLPTLNASGTYTRLDADRVSNGVVVAAKDQFSANAVLNVPLVAPSRWIAWQRANDQFLTQKANAAEVRRQIAAATARAYLTILTAKRSVDLNDRARRTAAAHLAFSQARRRGGVGTKLDEVRAAQQLHLVEVQEQNAIQLLVRAREQLGQLLGYDTPLDAADEFNLAQLPAENEALKEAKENRTDLKAQQLRLWAAKRSVAGGWADYMPLLSLVAQPFYQTPPTLTTPTTGYQAQLMLTLPLYDGGLRYGLQHERIALRDEAQMAADQLLRQVSSDVRTAVEEVRTSDDALRAARESASNANEALALTNLAYRAGATTNIEVIDAERAARDAESQVALAEDTARQARLDLLVASGRFP